MTSQVRFAMHFYHIREECNHADSEKSFALILKVKLLQINSVPFSLPAGHQCGNT